MLNPFREINWAPGIEDLRSLADVLVYGFAAIALALLFLPFFSAAVASRTCIALTWVSLSLSAAVYLTSKTFPSALKIIYFPWFFISACIGFCISNLLFLIFYYFFFSTFAAILRRMTGRDPLRLKKNNSETFWCDCPRTKDPKSYFRQY